jgi:hypothetical protein
MKIRLKKDVSFPGFTLKAGEIHTVILISSCSEGCKFVLRNYPVKFFWFDEFVFVDKSE